jgi:hypothetical protein
MNRRPSQPAAWALSSLDDPACHKRINTNDQYLRHLSDDVLPVILRKAFEIAGVPTSK